jgi:hypothetical protein
MKKDLPMTHEESFGPVRWVTSEMEVWGGVRWVAEMFVTSVRSIFK